MICQQKGYRTLWSLLLGILLWCSPQLYAEPQFPPLSGRVVDQANVLSADQLQRLTRSLADFEQRSSIQLVVATLTSLQGDTIEEYGYQLGRAWGIGQKDRNNGVLLLIAPGERKVRIEVGYGLEGTLTDALSSNIIQTQILPAFRQGNLAAGIEAGSTAIQQALVGEYHPKPKQEESSLKEAMAPLGFFLFLLIMFVVRHLPGQRALRRHGYYIGNGNYYRPGDSQSGSRSNSSRGGGFGGGGGSFGGGGASGGW